MGWKNLTFLLPYGEQLRVQRRFYHEAISSRAIQSLKPTQTKMVTRLLNNLLNEPEQFHKHVFRYVGQFIHTIAAIPNSPTRMSAAIILKVTYGRDIAEDDDLVKTIAAAVVGGTDTGMPGLALIDFFPFCECQS